MAKHSPESVQYHCSTKKKKTNLRHILSLNNLIIYTFSLFNFFHNTLLLNLCVIKMCSVSLLPAPSFQNVAVALSESKTNTETSQAVRIRAS